MVERQHGHAIHQRQALFFQLGYERGETSGGFVIHAHGMGHACVAARQHHRNMHLLRSLDIGLQKFGMDDCAHMAIQMGNIHAPVIGLTNLLLKFACDGFSGGIGLGFLGGLPEEAILIHQAAGGVTGGEGRPTVAIPLGSNGGMHTHVDARMCTAVFGGRLGPRTGHHDGAGGDGFVLPQVDEGGQGGLAHANVIGMQNDQPVGVRETQFFQNRIRLHAASYLKNCGR